MSAAHSILMILASLLRSLFEFNGHVVTRSFFVQLAEEQDEQAFSVRDTPSGQLTLYIHKLHGKLN